MNITEEMIDAAALSDAEFDGRNFVTMSRVDRERYLSRAKASLTAALSALPAGVKPLETASGDVFNDEALTKRVADFLLERDQQTTQDERDEGERESSAFFIAQMVRRHVQSALSSAGVETETPAPSPSPQPNVDVEDVARRIYEDAHRGMSNIWAWDDRGLDDEHPGTRERYLRYAQSAIDALAPPPQTKSVEG